MSAAITLEENSMKAIHHVRRTLLGKLASIVLLVMLMVAALPHGAAAAGALPNSIVSTGDSITRAFNTGSLPFTDAPANSWSTGDNTAVNSLYRRILALNPSISGHSNNYARSGAKVLDLYGQVLFANTLHSQYMTILIGANDVCASSESAMTSIQDFHDRFLTGMNTAVSGNPGVRIYVVSIPNVYNLWSLFKGKLSATNIWDGLGICQSMLANPTSTAQADVDRRNRVRQRNIDFNTQLQQVCAQFSQCHFDNNAVFNTTFVTTDVSTLDYFHPSLAGQAKLASVAWGASGLAP